MRGAFVGKGGAGKSTVCALFVDWYVRHTAQQIWVFDADLNMHQSALLGLPIPSPSSHLSELSNALAIRSWLRGDNELISRSELFLKTTPPGVGSRLVSDQSLKSSPLYPLATRDANEQVVLWNVGTYSASKLGVQCFHNNLSILENILSHSINSNAAIIADMVAGVDAFASSLHIQFDFFVLVVEPTPESIDVAREFLTLAQSVDLLRRVIIVPNKIDRGDDVRFIREELSLYGTGCVWSAAIPLLAQVRHARRARAALRDVVEDEVLSPSFSVIREQSAALSRSSLARTHELAALHLQYIKQPYIIDRFGDLSYQVTALPETLSVS